MIAESTRRGLHPVGERRYDGGDDVVGLHPLRLAREAALPVLRGEGAAWLLRVVGIPLLTTVLLVVIGGLAVRQAALGPFATLAVGAILPLSAFAVIVAASPRLTGIARQLLPGSAPDQASSDARLE